MSEELGSKNEIKRMKIELLAAEKKVQETISEKNQIENKLIECYRYLGTINRQLSILLDFGKNGNSKKGKGTVDFILESAQNLSGANASAFYNYNYKNGRLNLVLSRGVDQTLISKSFSGIKCKTLQLLFKKKTRVHGKFSNSELEKAGLNSEIKYFMALPLLEGERIKGIIFLGFNSKENMNNQELDFYEAFAMEASFALSYSNLIKKKKQP